MFNTLQPAEFEVVKRVYQTIISQSWFDRSEENEAALGALVIREFQRGLVIEDILRERCEMAAQYHFKRVSSEVSD